jgi:hypothetical protein
MNVPFLPIKMVFFVILHSLRWRFGKHRWGHASVRETARPDTMPGFIPGVPE